MMQEIYLNVFLWCGKKLFPACSFYCPEDDVVAITWSRSEEYLEEVMKIEL